jgi:glycosyltransferase involved in cell wall biosynthesis
MKILYFSRDYTPHDHRFLSALADSEHQVTYLRLERRGHQQEGRLLPPGVEIVPWTGGQTPYQHSDHRRLLRSLREVIRQVQPDVIHAGPVQTAAWLAAKAGFEPLVTMSWGSDLLIDAEKDRQMRKWTEFTLKHTSVLVGDCDAVRQKAVAFGFPAERVVTFPWGVDLSRFAPERDDQGLRQRAGWQDEFVILHLRSWEPVYGVDVFARAFVRAAQQRPELRLFLLGNGSLAGKLRQILMPVLDKVQFVGQVSQEKLPAYYQASDLYISASHSDGSSVSLMEALASGKPVLVSDIPGNKEWITEGQQGWLFADGDADKLAEKLVWAACHREELPEFGRKARQLAEARADWPRNFERLLEAYQMAVKE